MLSLPAMAPPLRDAPIALFVAPASGTLPAPLREALAALGNAAACVGGPGGASRLAAPALRPEAFQLPAHARSDALLRTILRLAPRAVLFASATDAFATLAASRWSGALPGVRVLVYEEDEPAAGATQTRTQLLACGLRDQALRLADAVLRARPEAGSGPREVAARDLTRWCLDDAASAATAAGAPAARPLVTVIVPHFNLGRYLPETLASIDRSTYAPLEVVVVDDGSTDPLSRAVFRACGGERRRLVEKPNGGLASARNAGLAVARGELVLPLDADDLVDPGYVGAAVAAHARDPTVAFVGCYAGFFRARPGDLGGRGYVPLGLHPPSLLLGNYASTCSAVIRRDAIEAVGGYDESWPSYEDWDLWCSMAEHGMRAAILPEPLFHYRVRSRSMVRTTAAQRDVELRSRMIRKHRALAGEHGVDVLLAHLAATPYPDARRPG